MSLQAWDVTLYFPLSDDLTLPYELNLPDFPDARLTESGGAQKYIENGEWEHGGDRWWIDTVFFDKNCDKDYVTRSLIDYDGYPSNIQIFKTR